MGTYLYTLRKPLKRIKLRGEVVEAACLKFLRKPYWDIGRMDRISQLHRDRAVELFTEIPKYVIEGECEEGANVYYWKGQASYLDDLGMPGWIIGNLRKIGREWHVLPLDVTNAPLGKIEFGMFFRFTTNVLKLFNTVKQVNYKEEDVFLMGANRFCHFKDGNSWALHSLPLWSTHWTVKLDIRPDIKIPFDFNSNG